MKDRELLELAAKAANIGGEFREGLGMCPPELSERHKFYWNPLTDDGDALRAAASKGISVIYDHPAFVIAKRLRGGEWVQFSVQNPYDYDLATRYAITYCLSQIGEKMP